VTVSGQTTQFTYDGDGNMVKKTNPDGSRTIYVGGVHEVDKTSGGTVTKTTVYYPGGAMRINGTLYYTLKDHLGSASVVTDSTGAIVGEQRYYPFGETRLTTGSMFTDKLYTSQREVTGLGIYHYGARFYSPKLGRFLSADSIVPNMANPQALNRYSYVYGNPLRFTDPSGNIPIDCWNDPSYCSNTTTLHQSPYIAAPRRSGGGGGGESEGGGGGPALPSPADLPSSGGGDSVPLVTVVPDAPGCWDYATSCSEPYGNYSLDLPGWHYYNTLNLVCPANLNCTADQMRDYLSRFSYPGQDLTQPVGNTDENWVTVFGFFPLGRITTAVSVDGLSSLRKVL